MRRTKKPAVEAPKPAVESVREVMMDLPKDAFKPSEPTPVSKRETQSTKLPIDPNKPLSFDDFVFEAGSGKDLPLNKDLPQESPNAQPAQEIHRPKVNLASDEAPVYVPNPSGHIVVVRRFVAFEMGGTRWELTPGRNYDVPKDVYDILKKERLLA